MSEKFKRQLGGTRLTALFLALALIFSTALAVSGLLNDTADENSPTVTVVTTGVENTYIEVGLNIKSRENAFHVMGAVLSYNPNLLKPVTWDTDEEIFVPSVTADGTLSDEENARSAWDDAVPLHTKGPDNLSGKTALAYRQGDKAYLYLSAESPRVMSALNQEMTATVPFDYVAPAPTPDPDPDPGPTPDPENPDNPDNPETQNDGTGEDGDNTGEITDPENPGGTTEPENPGENPGGGNEGGDTPTPTPTPEKKNIPLVLPAEADGSGILQILDEVLTPTEQAVVVRFKLAAAIAPDGAEDFFPDEDTLAAALDDALKSIDLCVDKNDGGNVAGQSPIYDASGIIYLPGTRGEDIAVNAQLLRIKYGTTFDQGGGGSDPSNFIALVFFDWDESTLIGSMCVDKTMETEKLISTINSYTAEFMPPNADGTLMDMSAWTDDVAKAYTVYDKDYILTSHDGYTFGKWIAFDSPDFTVYGKTVDAANAGAIVDIPAPDSPDFSKASGGLIMKAAYIANEKLDPLATEPERQYTVFNDNAPELDYFNRYGVSTSYQLKFKITRVNSDKNPIQRPRTTALRVTYNVGSAQIYSLVAMNNVDEQIVEVAAPDNADFVSVEVVDIGGVSNWVSGSAARSEIFTVNAKQNGDDMGYVIYGAIKNLNQQLLDDPSITTFALNVYTNAGLNIGGTNIAARRNACTYIRKGQEQKLAAEGTPYLSYTEMQTVITNKGASYK